MHVHLINVSLFALAFFSSALSTPIKVSGGGGDETYPDNPPLIPGPGVSINSNAMIILDDRLDRVA